MLISNEDTGSYKCFPIILIHNNNNYYRKISPSVLIFSGALLCRNLEFFSKTLNPINLNQEMRNVKILKASYCESKY